MQRIDRLKLAILLTFSIFLLELFGSFLTNSVALLSDSLHMLTDVFALLITTSALLLSSKKPDFKRTYGLHRLEILASLVNGITVFIMALFILYEAYERILKVESVASLEMFLIALAGLCTNAVVLKVLGHSHDLNVKGAYLHVLGDLLSSIAVLCGAMAIYITGIMLIDPILSIAISGVILFSAGRLVKEAVDILLEKAPKHINVPELVKAMKEVEGVVDVHDIRVWSVCSNVAAMSAHVVVNDMLVSESEKIVRKLEQLLENHGISLTTIQIECKNCGKELVCRIEHGPELI